MKRLSGLLVVFALLFSLVPSFALAATESNPFVTDLIAGQHTVVGTVKIWNDSDFLYVQYDTVDPYCLEETHVAVASDLSGIPQKNGNPIPGQFPYKASHKCATSYLYKIPMEWSACDLYIAAHAAINTGETAWGSGPAFPGKNWATYIVYQVERCGIPTDTATPTDTPTATATPTDTPTPTATSTYTPTATNTFTPTATNTPTDTPTPTPTPTSPVCCQPITIYADFSKVAAGSSVEGMGVVAPNLNIDAKGTAVKIVAGAAPRVFAAPNDAEIINGGIAAGGGFSDKITQVAQQAHLYTFTFAAGSSASDFSLHMLDFGDLNPEKVTSHIASMTGYDANGNEVSKQELNYTSDSKVNPRSSKQFGDLWYSGDAVSAAPGQPGDYTWHLSGHGIVKVVLEFGTGFDANIGFDTLQFTLECPQ